MPRVNHSGNGKWGSGAHLSCIKAMTSRGVGPAPYSLQNLSHKAVAELIAEVDATGIPIAMLAAEALYWSIGVASRAVDDNAGTSIRRGPWTVLTTRRSARLAREPVAAA